jgi:3-deoxy-7-phosphoheptulonate synthase
MKLVIVLHEDATEEDIEELVAVLHEVGAEAHISRGEFRTVIGVIGDRERVMQMPFEAYPAVEKVVPIMKPYKLVSREFREEPTVITISGAVIGGGGFSVIAGPCSVESEEQVVKAARAAKEAGAALFRGGAFKPRTSPYSFQGLGEEGLAMLAQAREETGLPIVTEVLDVRDIEVVARYADVLQVGARNMQNFLMLRDLGLQEKPIRGRVAYGGRVYPQGGKQERHPLRKRHPDFRDRHPQHPGHILGTRGEEFLSPARYRRPEPRHRRAGTRRPPV